jgi:CheY-like chemotaxis protein
MGEPVWIKVVGFTDVERHALNTLFRLSQERPVTYAPWTPECGHEPQVALLDGDAYESPLEAASPRAGMLIVWIGERAPGSAWRRFSRPIAWPEVVGAMDQVFLPAAPIDLDLDTADIEPDLPLDDAPDTQPGEPGAQPQPERRALIATADPNLRLYLRAKLALARMTLADEAGSAAEAMEMARAQPYTVALLDYDLPGVDGWDGVKGLADASATELPLIVMKRERAVVDRWRARAGGAQALLSSPPDPVRLGDLLRNL